MAEKRMFSKQIVAGDAFLDMPLSTQALYFHLSMWADDDGFINNVKTIQRMIGATDDDLKLLVAKKFIIPFERVMAVKHWRINNYIRNDRYKPTPYTEELSQLTILKNGAYTLGTPEIIECIPNGYQMDTQYRLDKIRLDEVSIEIEEQSIPSLDEIKRYIEGNNLKVNPQTFYDHYTSQGWRRGNGQKVTDWKAAIRTWEARKENERPKKKHDNDRADDIDYAAIYAAQARRG